MHLSPHGGSHSHDLCFKDYNFSSMTQAIFFTDNATLVNFFNGTNHDSPP
jgi:hypothetical protein